jgi:hypothetical protein
MTTIKRKVIPWKDREHLFTAANITKLEFTCCKDYVYRKRSLRRKAMALPHGPCIIIMKDGKEVRNVNYT